MAAHQVAIAKASLAAALLRPDPVSVGRDEIGRFHTHLEQALSKCTPSNVQICKEWLVQHIAPAQGRIMAFAKYLTALSASLADAATNKDGALVIKSPASPHKKRLHLLYVLTDLQHHTKCHVTDLARHTSLTSNLQPHLASFFQSIATYDAAKKPRHHQRVSEVLSIWEEEGYQSRQFIGKLRQTVEAAGSTETQVAVISADAGIKGAPSNVKEVPYFMPASHGDANTPYYDLPAGNLMPHIVPNSSDPINPNLVKPLQFMAGPADESLVAVVRDFLKDVDALFTPRFEDEVIVADVDEMGQPMTLDPVSGEMVVSESYYGWSLAFCERMRKRKKQGLSSPTRHRGRSRSRSAGEDSEPRKRRRYSYSRSSESSRRGASRSRSRSQGRRRGSHSRSRSQHRNGRSQSPPHGARNRSDSYSPPPTFSGPPAQPSAPQTSQPSFSLGLPTHLSNGPSSALVTPIAQITDPFSVAGPPPRPEAHPATHYNHNFPINAQGLPVPPPPPFHQGAWPPPPPSIPAGASFAPVQYPNFSTAQMAGFVAPPPPQFGGQLPAFQAHQYVGSPPPPQAGPYGQPAHQYGAPAHQPPPPPPPRGPPPPQQSHGAWQGGRLERGQQHQHQGRSAWQQGRGGRGSGR